MYLFRWPTLQFTQSNREENRRQRGIHNYYKSPSSSRSSSSIASSSLKHWMQMIRGIAHAFTTYKSVPSHPELWWIGIWLRWRCGDGHLHGAQSVRAVDWTHIMAVVDVKHTEFVSQFGLAFPKAQSRHPIRVICFEGTWEIVYISGIWIVCVHWIYIWIGI